MHMILFHSDILGSSVLLFQENATVGPVKKLIFASENGAILGFVLFDPIQKKEVILQPQSIKQMVENVIIADGYDALADPKDVIRVKDALKEDVGIIKERVVTESGQVLGRVVNATFDTISWKLNRLYINPPLGLKVLAKELILPAKKIVKIDKKQITVTDDYAKVRAVKPLTVAKPA